MQITDDVEIPQQVIDAHAAGNLVFFVGAGASMDSPSNLPSFKALAKKLAWLAGHKFSSSGGLDFFLGTLPKKFDVHKHTRTLIRQPGSAPNKTHKAIAELAGAGGAVRIVTTNFDTHLTAAAASRGVDIEDVWHGPALPMGANFSGIVHLHGSVDRPARDLVVTDGDFGRAYLTDAWAARFLLPMFSEHTVVFIGYSHEDTIMRYLSLGLPSKTRRYAFVSDDAESRWAHLNITPILYTAPGHDHSNLVEALQAWSALAQMKMLEHETRIAQLAAAGPAALTSVQHDYLVDRLRDARCARSFRESARHPDWLGWAVNVRAFQALFTGSEDTASSFSLAQWFADTFVESVEYNAVALDAVAQLGMQFSPSLINAVGFAAGRLAKDHPVESRRWKTLLTTSINGPSTGEQLGVSMRLRQGADPEAPAVIRALLRPHITLTRRPAEEGGRVKGMPRAELSWRTPSRELDKILDGHAPRSAQERLRLLGLVEDALTAAYELLEAYRDDSGFDSFSFQRAGVEPHSQDRHRRQVDAIIDALRDLGEELLGTAPYLADKWWTLGFPLFRRLALHLIDVDTARSPDDKLRWLLDRVDLYAHDEQHETYRVLASTAPRASSVIRRELLGRVRQGPPLSSKSSTREFRSAYAVYNLVGWLRTHAPDWAEASAEYEQLVRQNPVFQPRDHPDLSHWVSGGTRVNPLQLSIEDLVQMVARDAGAAADFVLNHEYPDRSFDDVSWQDITGLLSETAQTAPGTAATLWRAFVTAPDPQSRRDFAVTALIEGLANADLADDAEVIASSVRSAVGNGAALHAIALFLHRQIQRHGSSGDTWFISTLRDIARGLWSANHRDYASDDGWAKGMYSWPGLVTTYWLHEISRRRRAGEAPETGLFGEEHDALNTLLAGAPDARRAVQIALAADVYFLVIADRAFAAANVIPLFGDESVAHDTWAAFLERPRVSKDLLSAGLLTAVNAHWARLGQHRDHSLVQNFFVLVAKCAGVAGLTSTQRRKLLNATVLADDGELAEPFAAAAVGHVSRSGEGPMLWRRWLRKHISDRLNGVPREAESAELAAWADVIPYLGNAALDAITLFGPDSPELGPDYSPPPWDPDLLSKHADAVVDHLAARVARTSAENPLHAYVVEDLINDLGEHLSAEALIPLKRAARERGFPIGDDEARQ